MVGWDHHGGLQKYQEPECTTDNGAIVAVYIAKPQIAWSVISKEYDRTSLPLKKKNVKNWVA